MKRVIHHVVSSSAVAVVAAMAVAQDPAPAPIVPPPPITPLPAGSGVEPLPPDAEPPAPAPAPKPAKGKPAPPPPVIRPPGAQDAGQVAAWLDLAPLRQKLGPQAEVANGVAYDPKARALWYSGFGVPLFVLGMMASACAARVFALSA